MRKLLGLSICVAMAFGCGDDDASPGTDGGMGDIALDVPTFDAPNETGADMRQPDMQQQDMQQPDAPNTCATSGIGDPCGAAGCLNPALGCIEEFEITTGGIADPVTDNPEMDPTFAHIDTDFVGGLCVNTPIPADPASLCDATNPADPICGECATCVQQVCFPRCNPNGEGNDVCRTGYVCVDAGGGIGACLPGCQVDQDCQILRAESNGIPGIQTPDDCASSAMGDGTPANCGGNSQNFDNLQFFPDAICNTETARCEMQPFDADASGGDACENDFDCEEGGRCFGGDGNCINTIAGTCLKDGMASTVACADDATCVTDCEADDTCMTATCDLGSVETSISCQTDDVCQTACDGNDDCLSTTCGNIGFPGGACIKVGCDDDTNPCANDGVCRDRVFDVNICLTGCTVGAGADVSDPSTWIDPVTSRSGCREGYSCVWDGIGGFGTANNGQCVPTGDLNPVAAPNSGAACTSVDDCFNPFGQGRCLFEDPEVEGDEGYCSIADCAAPYFDPEMQDLCGDAAACVTGLSDDDTFAICIATCETSADCAGEGIGCIPFLTGADGTTQDACFPGCFETEDCQADLICEGGVPPMGGEMGTLGSCVEAPTPVPPPTPAPAP